MIKHRGSLAKRRVLTGIRWFDLSWIYFGPSDGDRAAQGRWARGAAALVAGDRAPTAELVGGSPELAKRALQSSVWIEVWPWSTRKARANHLDN